MILCSWNACNDKSAGHWYWLPRVWSSLEGCESLVRVSESRIGASARLSNFLFKKSFEKLSNRAISHEASIISSELSLNRQTDFLIYEGGVTELEVALRVLDIDSSARVWFNFHYSSQWAEFLGKDDNVRWLLNLLTFSIRKHSGRVFLFAESEGLASLVFDRLSLKVPSFPVFTTLPDQLASHEQSFSEARNLLTFYFEDFSRLEWLALQVELVGNDHPDLVLNVLVPARMRLSSFQIETLRKRVGTKVVIRSGYLEPNEYARTLRASILVVLIYDTEQYLLHSSGKIEDILYCGALPVVPSGSLASQNSRRLPQLDYSATQLVDLIPEKDAQTAPLEPMLAWHALEILRQAPGIFESLASTQTQDYEEKHWSSLPERGRSAKTQAYIFLIRAGFSHSSVSRMKRGVYTILNFWQKGRMPSL